MTTINYAEILHLLRTGGTGWEQKFPHRLARLREVLTDELLDCVNLGRDRPVPRDLTLEKFRARVWEIRLDGGRPQRLRDEAQEFDAACAIYEGSSPRPSRAPEFGQPCAYCWRTEEGRFASHGSPYGMCHIHKVMPDPMLGGVDHSSATVRDRLERNRARREVARSKALLRVDKPELFIGHDADPLRRYPINIAPSNRPITGEGWSGWLECEYPVLHRVLVEVHRPEALADPLATIEILEARPLTASERRFYSGETEEILEVFASSIEARSSTDCQIDLGVSRLVMQRIWEFPIAKCDAWLNLERVYSADTGREPDYEGLIVPRPAV